MTIRASCGHYIDDNCKCPSNDRLTAEDLAKKLCPDSMLEEIVNILDLELMRAFVAREIKAAEEAAREEGIQQERKTNVGAVKMACLSWWTALRWQAAVDHGSEPEDIEMSDKLSPEAGDFIEKYYEECSHSNDHICGECIIKMLNDFSKSAEEAAREEGVKAGQRSDLMTKGLIARFKDEGYQRGQMEMRERAAKVCDERAENCSDSCLPEAADKIRDIPIDSGERKS